MTAQLDLHGSQHRDRVMKPGGHLRPTPATLRRIHEAMVKARRLSETMQRLQRQGRVGFHIGALGEEAAVVASAAALREQDFIVPCYREQGAAFYRGWSLEAYLHSAMGTARDACHGRQMPDHIVAMPHRYLGVSAPIGTQITHAVGVAYASKLKRKDEVAAVYFGDGATSSHDFHAGLNMAAVMHAPVVFLCRNNGWAISLPTAKQTAAPSIAEKATGYGMVGIRCDGNDVDEVYAITRDAVERAAQGGGPTLIEMKTYRLGGHSTSDDASVYRDEKCVEVHRARDPLPRFERRLVRRGVMVQGAIDAVHEAVEAELRAAIASAEAAGSPALETVFEDVYAEMPWHLEEQRDAALAAERSKRESEGER